MGEHITTSFTPNGGADDAGNTYALAVNSATAATGCANGMAALAIYYAANIAGIAPLTVTITPAGDTNQQIAVVAVEYTGLGATPLAATTMQVTPGTASPFVFQTGAITTTKSEALIAAGATECAGYPDSLVWNEQQGFQVRGREDSTLSVPPGYAGDKHVLAAGSFFDSWRVDYTSGLGPGVAVIAAFE